MNVTHHISDILNQVKLVHDADDEQSSKDPQFWKLLDQAVVVAGAAGTTVRRWGTGATSPPCSRAGT